MEISLLNLFGVNMISYFVALLSSLAIFWSLRFSARRLLKSAQRKAKSDDGLEFAKSQVLDEENVYGEDNEEGFQKEFAHTKMSQNAPKFSFIQRLSMGLGLSFSLLRIFSYVFFSFALIILLELKMFNLYAYMGGVFSALIGMILQILFCKNDFASKQ